MTQLHERPSEQAGSIQARRHPLLISAVALGVLAVLAGVALLLMRRVVSASGRGAALTALVLAGALALTGTSASPAFAANLADPSCTTDVAPPPPTPTVPPTPTSAPTPPACTTDFTIDLANLQPAWGRAPSGVNGVAGIDAAIRAEFAEFGAVMRLTEYAYQDAVLRWFDTVDGSRVERGTAPFVYTNIAWTETFAVETDVLTPAEPITYDVRTMAEIEQLRRDSAEAAGILDYTTAQYEWAVDNSRFTARFTISATDRCGTLFTHTYALRD